MNQHTLDSLRRLAERPGTEAEGIVAREMLEKLSGKVKGSTNGGTTEREYFYILWRFIRREITFEEYLRQTNWSPVLWKCPCGTTYQVAGKCPNKSRHLEIQTEIRAKFTRGDRVFYNYWAYPKNCPGKVAAHIKLQPDNGTHPWGWLSVRFDHLKSARQVPVINADGSWALTHGPIA